MILKMILMIDWKGALKQLAGSSAH